MVVTLTGSASVLAERIALPAEMRPLFSGGQRGLEKLIRRRRSAYAESHALIDTDDLTPHEVADAVVEIVRRKLVVVPLGERTYCVEVGLGIREQVGARLQGVRRVVIVSDEGVQEPWGSEVRSSVENEGIEVSEITLPAGEEHKTLRTVESIWDHCLRIGVDRRTMLLAVGGGVVSDLAGFAAATLLRGVRFGVVSTSLLSMVDASVGGKTGFDRTEGKNLVGAFHQPSFVLCDIEVLSTLPRPERISGLAEVVKSAMLDGSEFLEFLERHAKLLREGDEIATSEAVERSVRLKAAIVSTDEREGGLRRVLNLGHTVGHALEAAEGYRGLRHGEAVSLGLVAALRVAEGLEVAEDGFSARIEGLLEALALPTDLDSRVTERVWRYLMADKKAENGVIQFIVPHGPGKVETRALTQEDIVRLVSV